MKTSQLDTHQKAVDSDADNQRDNDCGHHDTIRAEEKPSQAQRDGAAGDDVCLPSVHLHLSI